MNTPLMHIQATPTFNDVTPIFTPSSVSSSMMDYTSAMFAENHISFPAPSIEQTLIAPELRSMCHPHEVEHNLQTYAPAHPATTAELDNSHSYPISPFPNGIHIGSPDRHHHQFHHHHHHQYRHSYQPTTAFQDLEEAQHLSILQDMMHQSTSIASGISDEVLTSAAYALHPTMRRTQSFESFSPENCHTNISLSMANAMVGDRFQPEVPFVGSSLPMESSSVEGYGADYASMPHQNTFQMPSTSMAMAFSGDQLGSSPPTSASSSFASTFQPLFIPAFSANSSCYSPAISTSSPSIDSMSISIGDSGRTSPATPHISHHSNYKSDYDSDIDDITCNQKHDHNQISNHSRQCSLEPSADASSETDTQNDPSIREYCEDEDGTYGSGKSFFCHYPDCNRSFGRSFNLKAHALTHGTFRPFHCRLCQRAFARIHDRERHMSSHRTVKAHCCIVCQVRFARQDAVIRHLKLSDETNPCSLILKSQGITFRDVAAGRINRRILGSEDYIIKTFEMLENEIRKEKAVSALDRMKVPKGQGM